MLSRDILPPWIARTEVLSIFQLWSPSVKASALGRQRPLDIVSAQRPLSGGEAEVQSEFSATKMCMAASEV